MKKWLTIALALAAALTVVGPRVEAQNDADTYIPVDVPNRNAMLPWQSALGASTDLAPSPQYGMAVTDPTPRISVRFDDGRDAQYRIIMEYFAPRGIDVALCLNSNSVGGGGKLTWAQIREIRDELEANGAKLSIMQHGNDNFGALTVAGSFGDSISWAQGVNMAYLDSQLDPSTIIRETGIRPRWVVLPGDTGGASYEWAMRNKALWEEALNKWGYWWSISSPENVDPIHSFSPGSNINTTRAALSNDIQDADKAKPGSITSPYSFKVGTTIDLMSKFVESPSLAQWGNAISNGHVERSDNNPFPLRYRLASQADNGWLLENKTIDLVVKITGTDEFQSNSAAGEIDGYFTPSTNDTLSTPLRTFSSKDFRQFIYAEVLAGNYGTMMAFHADDDSDTASSVDQGAAHEALVGYDTDNSSMLAAGTSFGGYAVSLSPAETVGHMNMDMIAWILKALEEEGLIDLVTVEEYGRWVMGQWADGVDIIGNPRGIIPQYAIGDTIGPVSEYPLPRGWSAYGRSASNWLITWNPFSVENPTSLVGDTFGEIEWLSDYRDRLWPNSPGAYGDPGGDPGGVNMWTIEGMEFFHTQGDLSPGVYTSHIANWKDHASGLRSRTLAVGLLYRYIDWTAQLDAADGSHNNLAPVYTDSMITLIDLPANSFWDLDGSTYQNLRHGWSTEFNFAIPSGPRPFFTEQAIVGRASGAMVHWMGSANGDSSVVDYVKLIYRRK